MLWLAVPYLTKSFKITQTKISLFSLWKKIIGVLFLLCYFSLAAVLCKPASMYTRPDNAGIFAFQVKKEDFITTQYSFYLSKTLICSSLRLAELQYEEIFKPQTCWLAGTLFWHHREAKNKAPYRGSEMNWVDWYPHLSSNAPKIPSQHVKQYECSTEFVLRETN